MAALATTAAAACGAAPKPVGEVRFVNQPVVWRVNDQLDTPAKPEARGFPEKLYFFDAFLHRQVTRNLELPEPRRAMNINSLGEVPDSTWFTNRIGRRDLTLDEVKRGPNLSDGPDTSAPWKVKSSKTGGGSKGFIIKDSLGDKYIVKFDEVWSPTMESATDVAVQRLLWMAGYNVPENHVVYFNRDQLVLAEDAVVKDSFGNERPMVTADLEAILNAVSRREDGSYRALTSKFLPGIPIGGFAQEGIREDDPNDTIPHEHRREVRGLYPIFSWLQQTDVKEDNTLDIWREDPSNPERHYVEHYLLDFGKSFGTSAFITKRPDDGHVENVDFGFTLRSLLAFGLWKRPWEGTPTPGYTGVGTFDSEHYHPGRWKAHAPYTPFAHRDEFDMYWGTKIVMRFSEAHIRAALEQGRFEDERAVPYLTRVLLERQRKTGRYWFSRVNPVDAPTVSGGSNDLELCFTDLLLAYDLAPEQAAGTRYELASFDFDGAATGWATTLEGSADGRVCARGIATGTARDAYTVVRVNTRRGASPLRPVEFHVAADADGALRVVGINRR